MRISCRNMRTGSVVLAFLTLASTATVGMNHQQAGAAPAARSFLATAEASGMYVLYGIPKFTLVDNYLDGGGPVARASLGSDGTADALGALPYPGSTFVAYPGLVSFVLGVTPPGYPFYVTASHPFQPDQSLRDPSGSYSLTAAAKADASGAKARAGRPEDAPGPLAEAASAVTVLDGTTTATAESANEALSAGPLSVARVISRSITSYRDGDDEAVTRTEFSLEGGRVGDTVFSFGRDGLQVAQQGMPVPAGQGLDTLNKALAPAGLVIRFLEPTTVPGGAAAGAFEVVSLADIPGAGRGRLSIRFGGATSSITLGGAA